MVEQSQIRASVDDISLGEEIATVKVSEILHWDADFLGCMRIDPHLQERKDLAGML